MSTSKSKGLLRSHRPGSVLERYTNILVNLYCSEDDVKSGSCSKVGDLVGKAKAIIIGATTIRGGLQYYRVYNYDTQTVMELNKNQFTIDSLANLFKTGTPGSRRTLYHQPEYSRQTSYDPSYHLNERALTSKRLDRPGSRLLKPDTRIIIQVVCSEKDVTTGYCSKAGDLDAKRKAVVIYPTRIRGGLQHYTVRLVAGGYIEDITEKDIVSIDPSEAEAEDALGGYRKFSRKRAQRKRRKTQRRR